MTELRCPSRMHGRFTEDGLFEVKCVSRNCGASRETVVLHKFDLTDGSLVKTERFRNPAPQRPITQKGSGR